MSPPTKSAGPVPLPPLDTPAGEGTLGHRGRWLLDSDSWLQIPVRFWSNWLHPTYHLPKKICLHLQSIPLSALLHEEGTEPVQSSTFPGADRGLAWQVLGDAGWASDPPGRTGWLLSPRSSQPSESHRPTATTGNATVPVLCDSGALGAQKRAQLTLLGVGVRESVTEESAGSGL